MCAHATMADALLATAADHSLRAMLPDNAVFHAERLCAQRGAHCVASWTLLARSHMAAGSPERAVRAMDQAMAVAGKRPATFESNREESTNEELMSEARYAKAAILVQIGDDESLADAERTLRHPGNTGVAPPKGQRTGPHRTSGASDATETVRGEDSLGSAAGVGKSGTKSKAEDYPVPGGASGEYLLGLICHRRGRKDEAIRHYQRALSRNPTLFVAADALASLGAMSQSASVLSGIDDAAAMDLLQRQPQFRTSSRVFDASDSDLQGADAGLEAANGQGSGDSVVQYSNPSRSTAMATPGLPHTERSRMAQNARTPVQPNDTAAAAPPTTPANVQTRRTRARFATPSPSIAPATTPAAPGAPARRPADTRRSARLFATPDNAEMSAVSRMLAENTGDVDSGTPPATTRASGAAATAGPARSLDGASQARRHPSHSLVGARGDVFVGGQSTQSSMDLIRGVARATGELGLYNCKACIRAVSDLPPCHRDSGHMLALQGRAFLELGSYKSAEKCFRKALESKPIRLNGIVEYFSTVLWHLKNETDLAELAVYSFSTDRHASATWCAIGNCYSLQRDPDAALRYFMRATRINPNCAYAHSLAGHEHVLKEDFEAALASYREALRIDERHYNALYGIGQVLHKQEKYDLAERHFRAALRIHPRNSNLHYHLGVVLASAATAATTHPSMDTIRQSSKPTLQQALNELEIASKLDTKNPVPKFERAKVLVQMNNYVDARVQLENLRDTLPKEAAVHHELGRVCQRMGDLESALRCFNFALDIDPRDQGRRYKKAIDTLYAMGEEEDR